MPSRLLYRLVRPLLARDVSQPGVELILLILLIRRAALLRPAPFSERMGALQNELRAGRAPPRG